MQVSLADATAEQTGGTVSGEQHRPSALLDVAAGSATPHHTLHTMSFGDLTSKIPLTQ